MQVTYQGPFRAVDIPSLGLTVEAGAVVEVPDAVGADLTSRDDWTQTQAVSQAPALSVLISNESEV